MSTDQQAHADTVLLLFISRRVTTCSSAVAAFLHRKALFHERLCQGSVTLDPNRGGWEAKTAPLFVWQDGKKVRRCLSNTGKSCSWRGARVVNRGIAKQVVWVVGSFVGLKVWGCGSRAVKYWSRMQKTQVRIRKLKASASALQLQQLLYAAPVDDQLQMWSSCQRNSRSPSPSSNTPESSSKHPLNLQK